MIRISTEALSHLEEQKSAEFQTELAHWLLQNQVQLERPNMHSGEAQHIANLAISRCEIYDVFGKVDVASFAIRLLRNGEDYPAIPGHEDAEAILMSKEICPSKKMSRVLELDWKGF